MWLKDISGNSINLNQVTGLFVAVDSVHGSPAYVVQANIPDAAEGGGQILIASFSTNPTGTMTLTEAESLFAKLSAVLGVIDPEDLL